MLADGVCVGVCFIVFFLSTVSAMGSKEKGSQMPAGE